VYSVCTEVHLQYKTSDISETKQSRAKVTIQSVYRSSFPRPLDWWQIWWPTGEFWPTFPASNIFPQRICRTLFVAAQRNLTALGVWPIETYSLNSVNFGPGVPWHRASVLHSIHLWSSFSTTSPCLPIVLVFVLFTALPEDYVQGFCTSDCMALWVLATARLSCRFMIQWGRLTDYPSAFYRSINISYRIHSTLHSRRLLLNQTHYWFIQEKIHVHYVVMMACFVWACVLFPASCAQAERNRIFSGELIMTRCRSFFSCAYEVQQ